MDVGVGLASTHMDSSLEFSLTIPIRKSENSFMEFNRTKIGQTIIHTREQQNIIFGYTETDSEIEDVGNLFNSERIVQLDQVHGDIIFFTSGVKEYPQGDGMILNEENVMAVIRTADCTPLFFWSTNSETAGVIHVGWRGLLAGIVEKLLDILSQKETGTNELIFYTGPAIEGKCYTVQQDVVDLFKEKSYLKQIFKKIPDGFAMDVTLGIDRVLRKKGVPVGNIHHSGICTFCDPRFPSYRRGDREKRIFNFIIRK